MESASTASECRYKDPWVPRVNFQNRQTGTMPLWCAALHVFTGIVKDLLQRPDVQVDVSETEDRLTPLAASVAMGGCNHRQGLIQTGPSAPHTNFSRYRSPGFGYSQNPACGRQTRPVLAGWSWPHTPHLQCVKGLDSSDEDAVGHPKPYVNIRGPANRTALWHAVHQGD
jgi:hypothetical protein